MIFFSRKYMHRLGRYFSKMVEGGRIPTWEEEAIFIRARPAAGAQATSRTQSECPSSLTSSIQWSFSSLQKLESYREIADVKFKWIVYSTYLQILTKLSHPPDANRFTAWPSPGFSTVAVAGAHDTALQPSCSVNQCIDIISGYLGTEDKGIT